MALLERMLYFITAALSTLTGNLTVAIATIVILIVFWKSSRPKGIPPGPTGLPILGYLPFMGKTPHETFITLAEKYGPILSVYFGTRLVIVLNSYEAIKEAFVEKGEIFAGRPGVQFAVGEHERYSLAMSNGNAWKNHRRFAVNLFKDLGVGKQSIEPLIMDEIQHFLNEIIKFKGQSKDFSGLLAASIANNTCILVFGKRFEYGDPWLVESQRVIDEYIVSANAVGVLHFFPWLEKMPGIIKIVKQETLLRYLKDYKETIYSMIRERKKNYVEEDKKVNYMDAFIKEQKARLVKDENDETFPDIALEQNVRVMMMAGTESTTNTLLWSIICMMKYPEMQKKVQQEIDEVIGSERTPCWNDRFRTPYTEATIYEVQRYATMFPLNLPHKNIEECELLGYKIPKDTMILSNLQAVHTDKKLWNDPKVFRPERFLTTNGQLVKTEFLIPFSIGKRDCLGISLAKMELYLYFTSMLQKFNFTTQDGTEPSMEVRMGFTTAPKHFEARAMSRNAN